MASSQSGRLIDFIENEKHWFGVKNVRWLILDEADAMIGEGLDDNIRKPGELLLDLDYSVTILDYS